MFISKLEIKNFRNFGDPAFVIALKPFTLLLGENNVGKTNLLVAVSLLFGQELSSTQRRLLDVDDINYGALAKFKRQIADDSLAIDAIALQPFGCVFEELPSECIYGAIDVRGIATKGGTKTFAPADLQGAVSKITGHLIAKGVIPYDAMLQVATRAREMLCIACLRPVNAALRRTISERGIGIVQIVK